jgi:hypothetical protein
MGIRPQLTESAVTDFRWGEAGYFGLREKGFRARCRCRYKTLSANAVDACIGREGDGKIGKRGPARKPLLLEGFNDH